MSDIQKAFTDALIKISDSEGGTCWSKSAFADFVQRALDTSNAALCAAAAPAPAPAAPDLAAEVARLREALRGILLIPISTSDTGWCTRCEEMHDLAAFAISSREPVPDLAARNREAPAFDPGDSIADRRRKVNEQLAQAQQNVIDTVSDAIEDALAQPGISRKYKAALEQLRTLISDQEPVSTESAPAQEPDAADSNYAHCQCLVCKRVCPVKTSARIAANEKASDLDARYDALVASYPTDPEPLRLCDASLDAHLGLLAVATDAAHLLPDEREMQARADAAEAALAQANEAGRELLGAAQVAFQWFHEFANGQQYTMTMRQVAERIYQAIDKGRARGWLPDGGERATG